MQRLRLFFVLLVIAICVLVARAVFAAAPPDQPVGILLVEQHADRAEPVPAWDARSPQHLVRIDGALHQEHAGRYYPVVPGRISVRLADGIEDWDELVDRAASDSPAAFGLLHQLQVVRANRLGVIDLSVPEGTDLAAWCALAHDTGMVRYAEVSTRGAYLATQSDPQYGQQWALNNTGQTGGTAGADIDAEAAWDLTAGDPSIVVAILDSGTDIDHEDLAANVWHNEGEIPDNAVDDDGNGFVDDWEGWDFDAGNNDPRSTNYHGTHVAGIIIAAGSNGVGIAGLAGGIGGPGVRGMTLGIGVGGPNADAIDDAIIYAADNGAHVITMSLSIAETQAINDALDYAYNTRDVFIDSSAGNSGSEVGYPAVRPEVMAVGSTTDEDGASSFSNPGPEVEIAAPGSDILSTQLNNGYGTSSGTSFSSPYVAALAGLIRTRNPGLPAPQVRQIIIDSAEDVHDPGFDDKTGYGRINAFEALTLAATSDGTVRLDQAGYACGDGVSVTVSDIDLAGSGTIAVPVTSDTEIVGETVTLTETGPGSGAFKGAIALADAAPLPDGVLQIMHGDTIVVEYTDIDDGQGGTAILKSDSAFVDCVPPAIFDVDSHSISNTSATIVWSTDEGASSLVRYGAVVPPSSTSSSATLTTQHSVTLTGLEECTTYKFEVESADSEVNATVDDNGGSYYTFETWGDIPGAGVVPCHQGQAFLDRDGTYGCSDLMGLSVIDVDLDADPGATETTQVLVTSTTEPAGEWITLAELGTQSSRFEGSVALDPGAAMQGDGLLSVAAGDVVTVTYFDDDDGFGGAHVGFDTATTDCTAPFITDVRVTEISATRALIEWNTAEPATSKVEFGATPALGSVAEETALVTAHAVPISPYDACDRAWFRVSSADQHGDTRVADAGGQPFALNLKQIGGLVFHETFETDTGWTLPDDWERGAPQGLGTNGGDPASAWSGSYVIGNDLSGQGAYTGDYEPSTISSALSPVFSTRQERNLELIIRRKLGVTSSDEAGIYVITNGTDQAWTSNYMADDADWWEQVKDISAWADNKNAVQLEFRIESSDPDTSYGWNIDEVIVKDRTEPDYLVCGGCAGAPAFRGVTSVADPDPCGAGGLVVTWEDAAAWGTGATGTYDVHRGTSAAFTPDATNRVATGLTATSWTDAAAPVDTPVWYVVRARNDESCGGEGLADGNLVALGATETTSQSVPVAVGDTLTTETVGGAHVRLEWSPTGGADHYVVRRGQLADFSDAVPVGTTSGTLFEDPGAATTPGLHLYRVFAVNACGVEE